MLKITITVEEKDGILELKKTLPTKAQMTKATEYEKILTQKVNELIKEKLENLNKID